MPRSADYLHVKCHMSTEHGLKLMEYAQAELLGEVVPSFRVVSFELSEGGEDLAARFIFDGEPSKEVGGKCRPHKIT